MNRKKICLNMIVKNERPVIERCLASLRHLIDYWVIVDTGSSDSTQKVICDFLKDIPGELHERPWVDFAHNRNEALALAKKKGDYLLFIDADTTLEFFPGFQMPSLEKDFYSASYRHGDFENQRVLLINSNLDWKWHGVLHEELIREPKSDGHFLSNISINASFTDGHRSKNPNKLQEDINVMERELSKNPNNSRLAFHLAVTYDTLCMTDEALKNYLVRTKQNGAHSELALSWHRIGVLKERRGEDPTESYCIAYLHNTYQKEPLYHLANYFTYKRTNPFLGYIISKHNLSIPSNFSLFYSEKRIYDYADLWQFSEFSYLIGKHEEALKATIALLNNPKLPEEMRPNFEARKSELERKISSNKKI